MGGDIERDRAPEILAEPQEISAGVSLAALTATLALAACDSGSSTGPTSPAPTPGPSPTTGITQVQASRFLAQATMGATKADIAQVQSLGYEGWINAQVAMPRAITHWDWLVANGYRNVVNGNNYNGFDQTMWRQLISEPDQLRQRVGMALLEFLVVGIDATDTWRQFSLAAYVDVLLDNAFGNFRTILGKITGNVAMATFLTFVANRKASIRFGSHPDENYAREIMQLFTIGLIKLNMDGSPVLVGGQPIETYTQTDVSQLARVFTGLFRDSDDGTTPDRYGRPLVMDPVWHEMGASTFLGTTIPANTEGMAAIGMALDAIFAHPNVPPFVSKQLIQRLVTSNPSPAYIGRVAAVFANNGSGVRGDMGAVIRAILLDTEARSEAALTSASAGKLREPVMRFTGWARAFGATSPSNAWPIGDTSPNVRLGQAMGRSVTVFNFFRPGYTPPNTAISDAGMVAPEFQIINEVSVISFVNFMHGAISGGFGDVRGNYSEILSRASNSADLVGEVNMLLCAGQLHDATVASIRAAVDSISPSSSGGPNNRVYTAILLAMAAPEYLTLK